MKNIKYKKCIYLMTMLLSLGITLPVMAQRSLVPAQYFFNQYLGNAAMAGADSSLNIMLSYNKQYDDMPGAPVNSLLSADYYLGKRVGLGLNVFNQKAGLLNQTRVALSYAYHLPVAEGQRLSFGISAAVVNNSLPLSDVDGDQEDPSLLDYNSRGSYVDGDFGLAYTVKGLNVQASLPTIRNYIVKEVYHTVDRPTLFTSASYKFNFGKEFNSVEPKLCYTQIKGNSDLWDFGLEARCANNLASIQTIYHSSSNYTVGLGIDAWSRFKIMAFYTSETKDTRRYTDGNLSLNLRVLLHKTK
ncbi:PorP/SprF family type IX secretion system membrane protein [Solitalea lacus]|uniref:PorP/SprF family type IX secretion system membrane protein n=1 Tax=Solitalea lacus TaxID=2911172 RepID=UPI001EDA1930|nr:PorP/SprF family type IX secretion system membrane protein [Solitalea lacus]UKJ06769.1 PorP/SprF family type IX secretion system membrane protein [Solitalea lacus]